VGKIALKYQNLGAFEKHLEQAAKVQLSRVFLVVSSCSYERRKIVERILQAIRSKEGEINFQIEEGSQGGLDAMIDGLNTTSLLLGKQVLYLDGIDKLKKGALTPIADYAAKPSPFSYLLLGASSSKGLTELMTKGKKELIACDLSEEKPWDRKDRIKRMLMDFAAKSGRKISGDALEHLLENGGLNLPGLEQEIGKLITYAGERKEIGIQDVHLLCPVQKSLTLWQLAEAIAWKDAPPKTEELLDLGTLLPLLSQLRIQFQQGMTAAVLLERGVSHSEMAPYFPTLKPATLDKILPIAKARQSPFFKRALGVLFDIELMAKNSAFEPALILDLLLTKLTLLKRHYALSFSQSSR
jgi:DNA polymerase III subunit delta